MNVDFRKSHHDDLQQRKIIHFLIEIIFEFHVPLKETIGKSIFF